MTLEDFFIPLQIQTLKAVVNCVIPADDYPAGWDAGVGSYLLRQFQGDLQAALPAYHVGLDALNREAQAIYGEDFANLSPTHQNKLLTSLETGKVQSKWLINPSVFFRMVIDHTAEGFYSDPGNGGNQDNVSWRMIGFEVQG